MMSIAKFVGASALSTAMVSALMGIVSKVVGEGFFDQNVWGSEFAGMMMLLFGAAIFAAAAYAAQEEPHNEVQPKKGLFKAIALIIVLLLIMCLIFGSLISLGVMIVASAGLPIPFIGTGTAIAAVAAFQICDYVAWRMSKL